MAEYSERLLVAAERLKKVAAENLRKQGIDVNDPRRVAAPSRATKSARKTPAPNQRSAA